MPAPAADRWPTGATVLVRHVRAGKLRLALPTVVIADRPDGLALWVPPRSPGMRRRLADGRRLRDAPLHERFLLPRGEPEPDPWRGPGIVMFVPPAEDWSVWFFFNDDGSFRGWYGNLERRHVRWSADGVFGVDTADHALDVWVEPDRSWEWKDEDEFAEATGLPGYWTADEAVGIRAAGERLIKLAEAGDFPFDGTWCDFRPDQSWPLPQLPAGWDRPRVGA